MSIEIGNGLDKMEKLKSETNRALQEIEVRYTRNIEDLRKKAENAFYLAKTNHEMNEIRNNFEQELKNTEERHLEEIKEVQQNFFEFLKAL